jgi:uncharacterized protein involved in exopolysaccharide biosynthesis
MGATALLFLAPTPAGSQVYKWVDKKGRVHYTDNPDQLPEPQRSRVLDELEKKIEKERKRREKLKEQGIDVPERLPPPPPPRAQKQGPHPATNRLKQRQAAKAKWSGMAERARERVASLEEKCAELKAERDRDNQDRLTMSRPGAGQRYQKSRTAYQDCQKNLEAARHYLEVELPEQARKNGVPPGWIR